ncbi:MAG: C4-dicarboxylate transporter DctM subunit, partial [Flavobacteriales bacterium]
MSILVIGVIGLILLSVGTGQPLYVLIGAVASFLLLASGQVDGFESLKIIIETTRELSEKEVLLAIPFFVISGAIMSEGDIARRLIAVARACFGWLSGGLAVSTVVACIFFAAISGSSPVTVIAIGSIMYPAMVAEKFSERFSTGLVSTAGSLGILIPPSIPMIVYAIVVPGGFVDPPGYNLAGENGSLGLVELFIAGLGPGLLIGGLLAAYSIVEGRRARASKSPLAMSEVLSTTRRGFWALMLPVLILGGIYSGIFTPTQAAAASVFYALIVELYVHRSLTVHDLPRVLSQATVLIGALLIIVALAQGFNKYLTLAQVAEAAVVFLDQYELTPITFLILVNILLLIVGCFMDILSAILILVPLISPIALQLGIHPMHLAVIFIVNLEIGYLTPPLGLNLFVASTIFKKSLGEVIRSVLPFLGLMVVGLTLVTYVPTISLGAVSLKNGEGLYVPFPERRIAMDNIEIPEEIRFLSAVAGDDGVPVVEEEVVDPGRPLTIQEMMAQAEADREEEAMDNLAYDSLSELLLDYRRVRSGELLLEELNS